MNYQEFEKLIVNELPNNPVILLEGKRKVTDDDKPKLILLGSKLAKRFPQCIFRTGNAPGADELFSEGVASVDCKRLQFIIPQKSHRKKQQLNNAGYYSIKNLSIVREPVIYYQTILADNKYKRMLSDYSNSIKNSYTVKAPYLLRDTVKVIGCESLGLSKANFGIFYDDLNKPISGGTGLTMKVCLNNNVPIVDQNIWMDWL